MSKTWVRIISVLEIVGGVVGIGFVIWALLATPFNAWTLIIAPIAISIYILSLVAGVALWRGNSFGRKASIVVQAIQLPKIISPLIIFMFSFGSAPLASLPRFEGRSPNYTTNWRQLMRVH